MTKEKAAYKQRTGRPVCSEPYNYTGRQTERHRQIKKQTDTGRETNIQMDRQTERDKKQRNRQTYNRQTDRKTDK